MKQNHDMTFDKYPRKKTSLGESLAESHAYDWIWDSWQDSWLLEGYVIHLFIQFVFIYG